MVFVKIPEAFTSQEGWKQARSNPTRFTASWAASHKVVLADAWGWVVDSPGKAGQQLHGKARLATKELASLLAVSGQGGVFIDAMRHAVATQVQWIAQSPGETATAYFERGVRMGAQLGLVTQGGRLGARNPRDASVAVARVWCFPHVPPSWGPTQVTDVLASAFDDVVLLHHRRMGKERIYRFRAKHKFGDKDIVPLQVATDDGAGADTITMWATLAPPTPPKGKKQVLRQASVPFFAPREAALAPKATSVKQPAVLDSQGKETSPASVRVLSQREVPAKCKVVPIDKDGSCLYRAVARGLKWLSGSKATDFCHRDLRARAIEHIRRHRAEYEAEWDGQGPTLEKLRAEAKPDEDPFAKYLDLAAHESAYASIFEIKALSRLYDTCIIVIPQDGSFATMSFKDHKRKKAIALWYTPKHVDLLLPEQEGQSYPPDLFVACQGTVVDLRAGGRNAPSLSSGAWTRASNAPAATCSKGPSRKRACSRADSIWTRASNALSSCSAAPPAAPHIESHAYRSAAATADVAKTAWAEARAGLPSSASACSSAAAVHSASVDDFEPVPEPPVEARPCKRKVAFRSPQGADIKFKGLFQCDLCPFRKVEPDARKLIVARYNHLVRRHEGQGISKIRPAPVLTKRARKDDYLWRCPVCKAGLLKDDKADWNAAAIQRFRTEHRVQKHPEIAPKEWTRMLHCHSTTSTKRAKNRASILNRRVAKLTSSDQPPHFVPFLLPRPRSREKPRPGCWNKQAHVKVGFMSVWKCTRCGDLARRNQDFKRHAGDVCPKPPSDAVRQRRLKALAKLQPLANPTLLGFSAAQIQDIFASARRALEDKPLAPSSHF